MGPSQKKFLPESGQHSRVRTALRSWGDSVMGLLPKWLYRTLLKTFIGRPELAETAGFQIFPRRFDSPLVIVEEIEQGKLNERRPLPGIALNVSEALQLLTKLSPYVGELDTLPYEPDGRSLFWLNNGSFPEFDSVVLYCLLRHLKPKRYIELGCGYSSFLSSRALERNQKDGVSCHAFYCDPEPRLDMAKVLALGTLLEQRVQALPLRMFQDLSPGDVLFIDTSHVLKTQSDVEQELLRVVPSLSAGVWVHFHDIFTPYDYPEEWVFRKVRHALNEQYALECLLSGGTRYEVTMPVYLLLREHLSEMHKFFPRGNHEGRSFWIRKAT